MTKRKPKNKLESVEQTHEQYTNSAGTTEENTDENQIAQTQDENSGDVPPTSDDNAPSSENHPREPRYAASSRWRREGRSHEVAAFRDDCRAEYEEMHPGCKRRDAHDYAWDKAIATYPPGDYVPPTKPETPAPPADTGQVRGLSDIPSSWPTLPDNASLPAEVGWVQAQRLRIVEDTGSAVIVHLDRAGAPAPSHAALGWLETSIRSYAKFVDVVARSLSTAVDEDEHVRREKLAIEDMRALLAEMRPVCPHCGEALS